MRGVYVIQIFSSSSSSFFTTAHHTMDFIIFMCIIRLGNELASFLFRDQGVKSFRALLLLLLLLLSFKSEMCCMACILYNDVGIGLTTATMSCFFPLLYLTQKVAIFIVSFSLVLMWSFGGCQNSAFMIAPNCLHDRNDTNSDSLKRR